MSALAGDDDPYSPFLLDRRMAEEVRVLMVRRGVRQADLASALGINQTAVSHRLTGRTVFSVRELGIIAEYFGVSPADLLGAQPVSPTQGYLGNETYAVVLPFRATRARRRTLPPMPIPPSSTPGGSRPALGLAS